MTLEEKLRTVLKVGHGIVCYVNMAHQMSVESGKDFVSDLLK